MEGERKSVFERLGTIRPKASGLNLAISNRGVAQELKRDDLRHRVVHLTKRRSHHHLGQPMQQYHQHNSGLKRPKMNHIEPPPPPPPPRKKMRRRRKKPKVVDQENLDEGEIVDDDDEEEEYEEYEEEDTEEGEIVSRKDTRRRFVNLPEGDNISWSSLSDNNDEENRGSQHYQKNGQVREAKLQPLAKVKLEVEDSKVMRIKQEIFDEDNKRPSQVGSDYSDWSDGDDELLQLENNDQQAVDKVTTEVNGGDRLVVVKEEIEDSIDAVKNTEDLEAISDDDLDPMSDDFYDKSQTDMDELLNKSDSLSQFPDGTTSASTASTSNNDVSSDIKVLDILEIDWKSLITEQPPHPQPPATDGENSEETSAEAKNSHAEYRHRNSTISLLNRIGFSHDLAGPRLTAYIKSQLSGKLKDQYVPMFHRLPALHCYYREKREQREGFFKTAQEASCTGAPSSPLNGAKIKAFGRLAL